MAAEEGFPEENASRGSDRHQSETEVVLDSLEAVITLPELRETARPSIGESPTRTEIVIPNRSQGIIPSRSEIESVGLSKEDFVVAVDVDEVLGKFLSSCNAWHNATFGTDFDESKYKSYNFCETWKCDDLEALERVFSFFESDHFRGLPLVDGAREAIQEISQLRTHSQSHSHSHSHTNSISLIDDRIDALLHDHIIDKSHVNTHEEKHDKSHDQSHDKSHVSQREQDRGQVKLCVVTSRQLAIKDSTCEWLDRAFGEGTFRLKLFGNQWARERDAPKAGKRALCASCEAKVLIDDLPQNVIDAAPVLELGIILDMGGKQPWSKIPPGTALPPNVIICHSWPAVVDSIRQHLAERPYSHPHTTCD